MLSQYEEDVYTSNAPLPQWWVFQYKDNIEHRYGNLKEKNASLKLFFYLATLIT